MTNTEKAMNTDQNSQINALKKSNTVINALGEGYRTTRLNGKRERVGIP